MNLTPGAINNTIQIQMIDPLNPIPLNPIERNESVEKTKEDLMKEICRSESFFHQDCKSITSIAWNFDDNKLAVACWKDSIYIYEIKHNEEPRRVGQVLEFQDGKVAWHPTNDKIAFFGKNDKINVFDFSKQKITETSPIKIQTKKLDLKWHPNQDLIAFNDDEKKIYVWNMREIISTIDTNFICTDLNWNYAGDKIAFSGGNTLIIWDYAQNREYLKVEENKVNTIKNINWSRDGQKICFLTSLKTNTRIKIWNIEDYFEESNFCSISEIVSIDWSPDNNFIVVANKDRSVSIWEAKDFIEIMSIPISDDNLLDIKWSNSGNRFATQLKHDIFIHTFEKHVHFESEKLPLDQCQNDVLKSIWSPNGEKLLILFDSSISIWNCESNILVEFNQKFEGIIHDALWDKTSKIIICLAEEHIFYHKENQVDLNVQEYTNENEVLLIRYDKDSKIIAGAGNKKIEIAFVNENDEYEFIFDFKAHTRKVTDVRWSHQSKNILLSTSNDGTVKVWELDFVNKKENLLLEINKHIGFVNCAIWDESDNHIISVGKDQLIRIFNSETGNEIRSISISDENMRNIAWCNIFEEKCLLCLNSSDNQIQIFSIKTGFKLKNVWLFSEEESKTKIEHFNLHKSPQETFRISISIGKQIYIFDSSKILKDFETYEYLYFLLDYLPKKKIIEIENSELIERIINYYFCDLAPSVFHILSVPNHQEEFDTLIKFCLKQKIFPKKFHPSKKKESSLLTLLNKMRKSSIDLFFDFAIASQVILGNSIEVDWSQLKKYSKQNSSKVCQFLESRFKTVEIENFSAKLKSNDIDYSSSIIPKFDDLKQNLPKAFKDVVIKKENEENSGSDLQKECQSTDKLQFKILDIPLNEFTLEFIENISETNSFEDFCKSHLIISILDLLWNEQVKKDFIIKNLTSFFYLLLLIANSIVVLPGYLKEIEDTGSSTEGKYWIPFLIFTIVLACLIVRMIQIEVKEIRRGRKYYHKSFWNWVDWINILFSISCIIFNIVVISGVTNRLGWLRIFHSISFFFSIVRVFDFFRAFKQTCFLIEIVLEVIIDMRIFILLMTIFIIGFSLSSKQKKL